MSSSVNGDGGAERMYRKHYKPLAGDPCDNAIFRFILPRDFAGISAVAYRLCRDGSISHWLSRNQAASA